MSRIRPIQYNYIEYVLVIDGVPELIPEPRNWQTAEKGFYRNKQYDGMVIQVSDSIEFTGRTAMLLNQLYDERGVLADVYLYESIEDESEGGLTDLFGGRLDFSTAKRTGDSFACKINSNEISNKLESRWRTEISLLNTQTLDGNLIEPLTDWITVQMHDRGLIGENTLDIGTPYPVGLKEGIVLFTRKADSFYSLSNVFPITSGMSGTLESLVYVNQQNHDMLVEIDLNFLATIDVLIREYGHWFELSYSIWDVEDDVDNKEVNVTFSSTKVLKRIEWDGYGVKTFGYKGVEIVEILSGQGLSININYRLVSAGQAQELMTIQEATLNLSGNTNFVYTSTKALLPFVAFERIIKLMGGSRLYSDYLEASRLAIAKGTMIRNVPEGDDITYTFQKLYNSYASIKPLGLEVRGRTIRIEEREYFYQKFISYDFAGNVTDVNFEHDSELGYSELNIGFEASNFDEGGVLDEYNTRTVWATPINIYRNVLNLVSSIQASSYVIETLRRVQYQKSIDRTHDRRGDTSLFFLDLKDNEDKLRIWSDDFSELPQNVNDPTKAYNLRLSPANRLRKLGSWVNHGLMKFRDKYLVFSSSVGKSKLITNPIGEPALSEVDNVLISSIGRARYTNEKVTFKIQPMNVSALINSKYNGVPKAYGLFKFEYYDRSYQGYLLSYKPETNEIELILES